jgi:hypothetical protein
VLSNQLAKCCFLSDPGHFLSGSGLSRTVLCASNSRSGKRLVFNPLLHYQRKWEGLGLRRQGRLDRKLVSPSRRAIRILLRSR